MSQPIRARGGNLVFLIGPKNTNLVLEDVQILIPVKFCWILFSGFRGEVKNVKVNDGRTDEQRMVTIVHLSLRLRCTKKVIFTFFCACLQTGPIMVWWCMSVRPGLRPSVTVFRTFLLHALTYWAEILHVSFFLWKFNQVRVSSISVNVCRSYAPFGT